MGPSNVYSISKRSAVVDKPVIISVLVAVVALNLVLFVVWCDLRRSVQSRKRQRISAPMDSVRYEKSPAFMATVGAAPLATKQDQSYLQTIRELQTYRASPSHSPPRSKVCRTTSNSSQFLSNSQGFREHGGTLRRQEVLSQPVASLVPVGTGGFEPTLRRVNSLDTMTVASAYTSASAPLEFHEHLFRSQPLILDPSAPQHAPSWIIPMPKVPPPAITTGGPAIVHSGVPNVPTQSVQRTWSGRREVESRLQPDRSSPVTSHSRIPLPKPVPIPHPAHTHAHSGPTPASPRSSWFASDRPSDASHTLSPVLPTSIVVVPSPTSPSVAPLNIRPRSHGVRQSSAGLSPTHDAAATPRPSTREAPPSPPVRSSRRPLVGWSLSNSSHGATDSAV
ncbi:hypothetical protein B0H21DRAFT_100178 [Amylocystis lapponica]|nr:hypothetical protein B0H21DRAFT_100178 [Amylocystis lapponica]